MTLITNAMKPIKTQHNSTEAYKQKGDPLERSKGPEPTYNKINIAKGVGWE